MRRLLAIDRCANTDQSSVRLADLLTRSDRRHVDRSDRTARGFRIVAAIEVLAGDVLKGHLLRPHEILQTYLVRLDSGLSCDRIQHQLEREANSRPGNAAIRKDGAFVGRHRIRSTAVEREIVGSRQDARDLRRLQTRRERISGIGAGIDGGFTVYPQDAAVPIRITRNAVMMLSTIRIGGQMFAPVLNPAHGVPAAHRKPSQRYFFRQKYALVPETAADIRRNHPYPSVIESQTFGQAGAYDVGHLGCGMDDQLFQTAIPERNDSAALEWCHALPGGADLAGDLDRGMEGLGDPDFDIRFKKDVVSPRLVQSRRAARSPREHVMHHGEFLKVEVNGRRDVLRIRPGRRDAHGDEFPYIADLSACQRRLLRDLEAGQTGNR